MVVLIAGTTHTGKTALAQKLMERYKMPYYSIDHLKMGLIRSGQTKLTVYDDEALTAYLWPIVRETIKTAIENKQNLIVEGCYIPFDKLKDFDKAYADEIKFICLIMSEKYISTHFADIVRYENVAEYRGKGDTVSPAELIRDNDRNLQQCKRYGLPYILIDEAYEVPAEL